MKLTMSVVRLLAGAVSQLPAVAQRLLAAAPVQLTVAAEAEEIASSELPARARNGRSVDFGFMGSTGLSLEIFAENGVNGWIFASSLSGWRTKRDVGK